MKWILSNLLARIFGRPVFARLNRIVFYQAARHLGFQNFSPNESGEIWFLKNRSEEIRHVIDVGANGGEFFHLCNRFLPNLESHLAFEPNPISFQRLTAIEDARLGCVQLALSDTPGTLKLYDYADDPGAQQATLYQDVLDSFSPNRPTREVEIEATRLDDYCREQSLEAADLLKIDTEGHELKVLLGARATLARLRPKYVLCEFNSHVLFAGHAMADLMGLLEGYRWYRLLPRGLLPLDNPLYLEGRFYSFSNLLAVRND